jgi:cyclohexanecarboxylate-CoA ligase
VVEVEGLLLEHPSVEEVAVVGVADERLGERAAAVVVPHDATNPPTLADRTAFLAERRMSKHFWPEKIAIVGELPRTATGKIQKFRIKDLITDPHAAG